MRDHVVLGTSRLIFGFRRAADILALLDPLLDIGIPLVPNKKETKLARISGHQPRRNHLPLPLCRNQALLAILFDQHRVERVWYRCGDALELRLAHWVQLGCLVPVVVFARPHP